MLGVSVKGIFKRGLFKLNHLQLTKLSKPISVSYKMLTRYLLSPSLWQRVNLRLCSPHFDVGHFQGTFSGHFSYYFSLRLCTKEARFSPKDTMHENKPFFKALSPSLKRFCLLRRLQQGN